MAFRSDIRVLVLGSLQKEPLHGYEIVRRLRETGAAGRLTEGQIYPYLHDLEESGYVSAEWQTDTGGAPRRVYQLTESGARELESQKRAWSHFVSGVGSVLAIQKEGSNA